MSVTNLHNYDHAVFVDDDLKKIIITRFYEDGREVPFKEINLKDIHEPVTKETFEKIAHKLGKILLLDSPNAKEVLKD